MTGPLAFVARTFRAEVDEPLLMALRGAEICHHFLEADLLAARPRDALVELDAEFCRLFVLPQAPCSPHLAVIRGEPLLGGRAARLLESTLRLHGLECPDPLMRDHVATFLEVAQSLCDRERSQHLVTHRPWMVSYFQSVEATSTRLLYRNAASLAQTLLADVDGTT